MPKTKIVFCRIIICWEVSTYQISETFIKRFRFCQFYQFFVSFGYFLAKKAQKMLIWKNSFCNIFFCWEVSTYQISENFIKQFDFANFLHFWSILAILAKKGQNRKIVFLSNFLLLGSIYIPNFRKFYQTV